MKCPNCNEKGMFPVFTEQGVVIDYCPHCEGVWLDKGEIFHFTKKPKGILKELNAAIKQGKLSERICPRTGKNMQEIEMLSGALILEYSPASGGLWLDKGELEKLTTKFGTKIRLKIDRTTMPPEEEIPPAPASLPALPNLFIRSTSVLIFLYGLLTLILITLTLYTDLTPGGALIIGITTAAIQFLLGPFLTDISLQWFYKLSWAKHEDLPNFLRDFITSTCKENNMKNPKMGIIMDGAPNAFTYGHTPNNARVVLTQGLIDLLNEEEVKGVVAHEIGHAKHWDMLIMTAAQLVPLLLYYIYRILIRVKSEGKDKSAGPRMAIAIASYILYIVSQYFVLWLSRTREYFADRFAGDTTQNPNCLASALVKIGYGLAGKESEKKKEDQVERNTGLEAVGALGIFDPKSGVSMAVSSLKSVTAAVKMGDEIDKENLKGAMKWDLWNPWAKYYEINSTHPLIANRLNHLSKQSQILGKKPYIQFDETKPESYWDQFFVDVCIRFLPQIALVAGVVIFSITNNPFWIAAGFLASGITSILKTKFSYKSDIFPDMAISSLLKKVKVSSVRPVGCKTKGTIIGRGIPGLIWSEDFVMQDETGIIFLDYRQPIPLWDFFFGLLKRARYNNQEVDVIGWYRRAPVPYIELKSIKAEREKERNCYTYIAKYVMGGLLAIIGCIVMLIPGVRLPKLQFAKSLPQDEIEYISDSYGTFQEAFWEKVQVSLPKVIKESDFQPAEITTFGRKLEIMTKPESFSKAEIASKFRLKGDFDIQMDCYIDFMEGKLGSDHYFFFVNLHDEKKIARRNTVGMSFSKKGETNPGVLRSVWWSQGRLSGQRKVEIAGFQGSLRFVKGGQKITTLFKRDAEWEWTEMASFSCSSDAFQLVIGLQNFIGKKNIAPAQSSLLAIVDNFKVNIAEYIIE
jgi:heat shock protein HtpX